MVIIAKNCEPLTTAKRWQLYVKARMMKSARTGIAKPMKRLLLVVLTSAWLTACSSVPEPPSTSDVDAKAVTAQQQQLKQLDNWRLRGQMALFDLREDDRHGLYVDWSSSADQLMMRFSHPLRGTLAKLEQSNGQAVLIDEDGKEYRATTAQELLWQYFRLDLPMNQISAIVIGQELPDMVEKQYQLQQYRKRPYALLSNFVMLAADQVWRAQLGEYELINGTFLPHSINLTTDAWRLKLQVSQWRF
ncbi:MAG: outer membrane lipoprotein LolB [Idiomarina sp.]|uniref:Outer-membrane lipoprotein LolB n=2 Tax=Pseudidiomarina marina TaxID=502366 RepID=A0A432YKN1_9GAMM|nr:MAG: outer membrane lipoprotein LolB [Idiomarina sp.]RUO61486.1 outer membrane lipoprotein LolB [Pseudidiomarina marina]